MSAELGGVERLVVIGNGMAGGRLVEELVAGGYSGRVTVLGEEEVPAYNRLLLSSVLEGAHDRSGLRMRSAEWYADHRVDLRLGTRVLHVDRDACRVLLADGTEVDYDRMVLATGSVPTLPPIRGLVLPEGRLHPAVHAFRSLADCDRLLEAVPDVLATDGRAVVVGGGLLGLQVARALAVRGVRTEIVEGGEHLLHRQLGSPASGVLRRELRRLGTEAYVGTRAVRLTADGLQLDTGYTLETDLVVLAAGGRPSTALARAAGLMVHRGVVVDAGLVSVTDDRIHAIGDCAEHRSRTPGLVGPGWEQARVLARRLCGGKVRYDGSRTVARLRATGLDVAVLGDPEHAEGEVVEVTNPVVGSSRKVVVRDGRLVAASLVGDLARVGLLTQLFDNGTVLGPHEPGELLLAESSGAGPELTDEAEVCACAGVSAGAVRACAGLEDARQTTRATTGCGGCLPVVEELLAKALT